MAWHEQRGPIHCLDSCQDPAEKNVQYDMMSHHLYYSNCNNQGEKVSVQFHLMLHQSGENLIKGLRDWSKDPLNYRQTS